MSQLQTYKFWLENDPYLPMFKRFKCQSVPVSLEDVILKGVHPVPETGSTDWTLAKELHRRINKDLAKVPGLIGTRYSYDISEHSTSQRYEPPLQVMLKRLQNEVYFTEDLDERRLYELAQENLRSCWDHPLATKMAKSLHSQFGDLRRFLKEKDKSLKLSGYDDLGSYNLGKVLSVDDFQEHEHLVIEHAFPVHNFRSVRAVSSLTDEQGRVRLVPEFKFLSITIYQPARSTGVMGMMFDYSVERDGNLVTFRPDIGDHEPKRRLALQFALKWRTDNGQLVFKAPLESLFKMVEEGDAKPTFPNFSYNSTPKARAVYAKLPKDVLDMWVVGGFCTEKWRGESLKAVVSTFGKSTSGTKEQLLNKVAALGVEKYEEHEDKLHQYFCKHRFIRVEKTSLGAQMFPILAELQEVGRLVLAMYILKHLRGNTILDPEHVNQAYSSSQLADALVHGRVAIGGGFVKVA